MYLNKPAHGIAPVKRALRPAQNVNTFYVRIAEVERRFVYIGNIVHIQPHGRRIDARTDAADVNGSREPRTVIGDEQIGHYARQVLDRPDLCCLHFLLRKHGGRSRLLAQLQVFLRAGYHHHLLDIHHAQGIGVFGTCATPGGKPSQRQQDYFLHPHRIAIFFRAAK